MSEKTVRIGAIGISHRGSGMLRLMMRFKGVICPAVCDIYEDRRDDGIEIVKNSEHYSGYQVNGYLDYKEMLEKEELDAVLVCTTWISHARIATDAMKEGLHVGVEVGGAASEEECWQMVRASEENGKFCMLLENCCYGQAEMAIFNMVKKGVFGEIIHLAGGYEHDLRDEIAYGREIRHGRLYNFMRRNGDLYPTHQLGPIAKLIGINRGNRFLSLVSMSSKSRGLNEFLKKEKGEEYDITNFNFNQGDITTTMIKCANGETISLIHDCTLPRPYSRNARVQGTKGLWMEDGNQIYIEGRSPRHEWESFDPYMEEFAHPLWKIHKKNAAKYGHGGMDFLIMAAFVDSAKNNYKPPIDVYDTAAWMAVTYLSEQSVAMGSMPVPVPDFTNGMWIDREPTRRGIFCLDEVCEEYFTDEEILTKI